MRPDPDSAVGHTGDGPFDPSLAIAERGFRQLADQMEGMVCIRRARDGAVLFLSRGFERIWGCAREAVCRDAEAMLRCVHPDHRAAFRQFWETSLNGQTASVTYRVIRPDGTACWICSRAFPLDDGSAETKIATLCEDVTARTQAEAALAEALSKYQSLFEDSAEPIVVVSADGRLLDVNRTGECFLGYDREELLGRDVLTLHPASEHARVRAAFARATAAGRTLYENGVVLTKAGTPIPVTVRGTRIVYEGRDAFLGIFHDLSEEKRTDALIRASEERFSRLAENVREVFWVSDPGMTEILYVSPAFECVWGIPRATLYRDPNVWRATVVDEDQPVAEELIRRQLDGLPAEGEGRIRNADGAVCWIRFHSFPWIDAAGRRLVVGIADDVTQQKRLEEERLAHLRGQRDALVREVHHRIKNHLQGVTIMLRNFAATHPEVSDVLSQAIAQVRAVAVVHGIQGRLADGRVSLCSLVPSIVAAIESLLPASVTTELPIRECVVALLNERESVPVALILNELIFNAVKHGGGDGKPLVRVVVSGTGDAAQVRIVNAGRLPADFDFADRRGTGAGLDLVRSLLPRSGAALSLRDCSDGVEAVLCLQPPAIAMTPVQETAHE